MWRAPPTCRPPGAPVEAVAAGANARAHGPAPSPGAPMKPFHLSDPYYEQGTAWGRLRHQLMMTDPRLLITAPSAIERAKALMRDCRRRGGGLPDGTSDADMWRARTIVESCCHPSNGEPVFPLFRMGAIAPVNIPIVYFMLNTPPTALGRAVFWHVLNQTYNSACNISNGSKAISEIDDWSITAAGYAIAVTWATARIVRSNMALAAKPKAGPPSFAKVALLSYMAVAEANFLNIAATRCTEIRTGVPVYDEDGELRGHSSAAGTSAIALTALSRGAVVPATAILMPVAIQRVLRPILPRGGLWNLGLVLGSIYASLSLAVPAALALTPQRLHLSAGWLEPRFRGLTRRSGTPVERLHFNKGL